MTMPPPRLSDEAHDVLADYRQATPGAERKQANLQAVLDRVESSTPPRAAAAAGMLWPIGWGVGSAIAAAGLIWGIVSVRSPVQAPPPSPVEIPQHSEVPPASTPAPPPSEAPPEVAAPVPTPAPIQRPTPKPRASGAEVPASSSVAGLREETRRLRGVRRALADDAYDAAARQLEDYAEAFPDGALREDAQAYGVVVACKRGRDARALRTAFARRYPDSPHGARIDAACEGEKQ